MRNVVSKGMPKPSFCSQLRKAEGALIEVVFQQELYDRLTACLLYQKNIIRKNHIIF